MFSSHAGKNPEDVVRRYMQKVKNPPDEVSLPPTPVSDMVGDIIKSFWAKDKIVIKSSLPRLACGA